MLPKIVKYNGSLGKLSTKIPIPKIPKNINRNKYMAWVIKAFQRRYRQELINGKIDKECLIISQKLIKK